MYSSKPDNNNGINKENGNTSKQSTKSENSDQDNDLPLAVLEQNGQNSEAESKPSSSIRAWLRQLSWKNRALLFIPIIVVSIAIGGVMGLYRQPLPLQKVMLFLGLEPGAGSNNPIAVPVKPTLKPSNQASEATTSNTQKISSIVALGRLLPAGEVITVALPSGVRDARIASLKVTEGSRVSQGEILAVLDNESRLSAARDLAKATIAVREATLTQTKLSIKASLIESKAALERAKAAAYRAKLDYQRTKDLYEQKLVAKADYDKVRASYLEAVKEVERHQATLSRFTAKQEDQQPDVVIAMRNLQAAKAEFRRAQEELEQAYVRAPVDGTVLEIHTKVGEKPGNDGVLDLGNVDQMTAKLEVYETLVRYLSLGDQVKITTKAFPDVLYGQVSRIGWQVKKQSVISADPAANTDARVVEVIVKLDQASSELSSHFTNLQVEAKIFPGVSPESVKTSTVKTSTVNTNTVKTDTQKPGLQK